ncbi:MAG: 30S ribosomal protein S20 [Endomicrobiia bacterium]
MAKLKTGRHTSALKELRKSKKRRIANLRVKLSIRKTIRELKKSILKKDVETSKKLLSEAYSIIDKAAKKNILHKNAASRKKAQLAKLVNSLISAKV